MLARRLAPVLAGLAIAVAVAAPAVAQEPGAPAPPPATDTPPAPEPKPQPTIKPGVTAAGVDLSGLTLEQAQKKLDAALRPKVQAPLVLDCGGRRWVFSAKASNTRFDSLRTARRALRSKTAPAEVKVAITHSHKAVRAFVAEVARRVAVAPRDASVRITLSRVVLKRSRPGKKLEPAPVVAQIHAALDDAAAAPRELRSKLAKVRPAFNSRDARRAYRTVVTVDKAHFKLRLFKSLRLAKSYSVAVGQPAYPTPSGLFRIVNKQVNPTWSVPNSPWAGELAGTTVAGGSAANPLKARWMGIVNGVGIHGTGEDWSIGQRASHGCIRMHVWDVIDLYPRVPVGTPVLLA